MNKLELDLQKILSDRLHVSLADVEAYCQRWKIVEFSLFGSVLRDDFRPDSDVDVLIVFEPSYCYTLSAWLDMQEEIERLIGRKVDLTQKKLLKNPYSRAEILETHRIIYPFERATFIEIAPANKTMQDNVRNNAALLDMAQAIQEIQEDTAGLTYEDYLNNRLVRRAVERNCEIIGEAVRRITPEFRAAHPEVNWGGAVGLRNILIHQYDRIDDAEIWRIITTEIPGLLEQIRVLIPQLPKEI